MCIRDRGAHASLQVLSGGEAAGEEVAPAGSRRARYGGERYSGQDVGGSPGAGGGAQHVLPPGRLVAAGRGAPGRAGLPARARRAGHRVRGGACPWPAQRRKGLQRLRVPTRLAGCFAQLGGPVTVARARSVLGTLTAADFEEGTV